MAAEDHHETKKPQILASSDHNTRMQPHAGHRPSALANRSVSALLFHPPKTKTNLNLNVSVEQVIKII